MLIRTGKIITRPTAMETSDLVCPRCGGDYLHHIGATFYDRGEDADQEVKIAVRDSSVTTDIVDAAGSGNPSARRHGLAIQFECEACSVGPESIIELIIAQHKGNTEIGWRYSPKEQQTLRY